MTQDEVLARIPSVMSALTADIPYLDAMKRGAELYAAPQLSLLAKVRPKENTVSRIIGDLLDPRGTHGQGPLFLNALLDTLERRRIGRQDPVSVVFEATTDASRRIDILITTGSDVVGIENKRGAKESVNQLEDYRQHILSMAKGRRHGTLVFLSDIGPEKGDSAVHVTYRSSKGARSLEGLLEVCMPDIKAERTRAYVGELIRFIREEDAMANGRDDVFTDAVLELPPEQVRALAATVLAGDQLYRRAIDKIEKYIKARSRSSGLLFEFGDSLFDCIRSKKNTDWIIRCAGWMEEKHCHIAIQSTEGNGRGIWYGVVGLKEGSREAEKGDSICPDYETLRSACSVVIGGHVEGWWPWWAAAEIGERGSDWSLQGIMSLIVNCPGEFPADVPGLNRMIDDIVALARAISPILTQSSTNPSSVLAGQ